MFSLSRLKQTASSDANTHLRRAMFFGAGLLLLWGVLQVTPTSSHVASAPSAPQVSAADASSSPDGTSLSMPRATDGLSLFTWGNLAVLVILAGGGALAFYLHRRTTGDAERTAALHTIEQLPLAQNQQLRLVRCASEVLLLGVGNGEITLLKTYSREAFEQQAASSSEALAEDQRPHAAGSDSGFADLLQRTLHTNSL